MSTRTCLLPVVLVAVLLTLPCTLEGQASGSDSGASITEHVLRWQASPPSPSIPVQEMNGFGCALTDEAMEQLYRDNLLPDLQMWMGRRLSMAHFDRLLQERPPNDVTKVIMIKNNQVYLPLQATSVTQCERPCNKYMHQLLRAMRKWAAPASTASSPPQASRPATPPTSSPHLRHLRSLMTHTSPVGGLHWPDGVYVINVGDWPACSVPGDMRKGRHCSAPVLSFNKLTNVSGGPRGVGLDILIPVPPERIGKPAPAGAAKEALAGAAAEAAAGSVMNALAGQGARRKTAAAALGLVTEAGAGAGAKAGVHCGQERSERPEWAADATQEQQEGTGGTTQEGHHGESSCHGEGHEARRHLAAALHERKHSLRGPLGLPKRSRRRPRPPRPSPDSVSQPATSATQGEEGQAEEEEDDDESVSLPDGASDAPVPPHHPAVLAGTHVKLYSLPWAHKLQRAFWRGSGYCTGYPHYFVRCSRTYLTNATLHQQPLGSLASPFPTADTSAAATTGGTFDTANTKILISTPTGTASAAAPASDSSHESFVGPEFALDVGLSGGQPLRSAGRGSVPDLMSALRSGRLPRLPSLSMKDHARFKFLLHLDGVTASYRLAKLLSTDSPVIRQWGPYGEHYDRSLKQGEHFLSFLKDGPDDLHDVLARYWDGGNDEELQRIAHNAQRFVARYLCPRARMLYLRAALAGYKALFPDMDRELEDRWWPEVQRRLEQQGEAG